VYTSTFVSKTFKRYSLAVGPPKKDPKIKGVQSAAVQAFLRRKEEESRGKELEAKRKKEELLAKRIELKHDRKARAMASRTKDNFYGYNGIPTEEKPKKRQNCENIDRCTDAEYMTEDEAEQFEYSQTESEHEPEEYEEKPSKAAVKPKAPPKSVPTPMNFVDLLRLAEKKQYEPVEIKVVKKTEERPRTAEELREREFLDRKNKKGETQKEKKKPEKEVKNVTASSSSNKVFSHKEFINAKLSKNSVDKHSSSKGSFSSQCGADKKYSGPVFSDKHARSSSSSKSSQVEKAKVTQNGSFKSSSSGIHNKSSVNGVGKFGSSSHTPSSKAPANGAQKLQSAKELSLKKSTSVHTKLGSTAPPQHEIVKNSSSGRSGSSAGMGGPGRPGSSVGTGRPGSSVGIGGPGRLPSSAGTGGPGRPGSSAGTGGPGRLGSSVGPGRLGSSAGTGGPGWLPSSAGTSGPGQPGSSAGTDRPRSSAGPGGPGRSAGTGGPGRPGSSAGTGPGKSVNSSVGPGRLGSGSVVPPKPKCTVVSETISSKNLVSRPSNAQMNGMRPPSGHRPVPSLPPISYKRQIEDDEEYDSEMDDFIDDEGQPQEEISKHIREIFGYDRNKYNDESDYALRYMESSWKEQQKEEARR
uniref:Protein SPT2 homolog n=1 Tax=Chelydra serpentina TaxID=8475 RepID=A0A8C3SRK0_CHESE